MEKTTWIIANWKSNKTIKEALGWLDVVGPELSHKSPLKIVVCPTFLDLEEVKKEILVNNYPLMVGAQDLSPFDIGSYTGEEAAKLLSEVVDLAILGHSERRNNFAETDEIVVEKVEQARKYNIIPLVCVQNEKTFIPAGVNLVAYEPVFAIGTGNPDTPQNASNVANTLKTSYGDNLEVLYGGSVNETNTSEFLEEDQLNGLLIGKSSLDPKKFLKIIEVASKIN